MSSDHTIIWLIYCRARLLEVKLRLSELESGKASHCRCNFNKRQGCFEGKRNDRLIGQKLSNLVETKKENQGRKVLIVIQSFRINLPSWPMMHRVITLYLQFILLEVVYRVMTLYLQSILRPVVYRISLFAIYITASST